jgi:hypothetical protein
MRFLLGLLPILAFGALGTACSGRRADVLTNGNFDVDCRGTPCEWTIVSGHPTFGDGWTDGDVAVVMSGDEKDVVEQRAVLIQIDTRQLLLDAAVVRDDGVGLRFELDWYAAGQGFGKTFWDRSPTLLEHRELPVWESGVNEVKRPVIIPSEAGALVLRIVKEGSGKAIVDELTLGDFPDTSSQTGGSAR